ncbi:MAG: extracellular solute-binding protein [Lachnospiraceae bacterium]|nr:extracellular solute-binding protein [Lachnospiraceae bacterium]
MKERMMKKFLFSALLYALFLTSCGNIENISNDSRTELILATIISTNELKSQVHEFNTSNSDFYITINDYMAFIDTETIPAEFRLEEARLRLDVDIVSRNRRGKTSPDIIVLPTYVDHFRYAQLGLFEDLTASFNEEDYLNVFEAIEVDGKLFGIFPHFLIEGILTRNITSDGDLFDTLISLQKGADYSIVGQLNRNRDFYVWIMFCIDEFINWEEMECDFNHSRFISVAEMLKNRPDIPELDLYVEYETIYASMMAAMRENPFFVPIHISNIYAVQGWKNLYGRDAVYTGFPGNKNMFHIIPNGVYAISRNSKNKEAARKFINGIMDSDYQMDNFSDFLGIPVLWEAVESMISDSINEKNNEIKWSEGSGDYIIDVTFVEPDIEETFRNLLHKEWWIYKGDIMVVQILLEELEFYFNDVKTLEQVIEIINNRMGLYLKENS